MGLIFSGAPRRSHVASNAARHQTTRAIVKAKIGRADLEENSRFTTFQFRAREKTATTPRRPSRSNFAKIIQRTVLPATKSHPDPDLARAPRHQYRFTP